MDDINVTQEIIMSIAQTQQLEYDTILNKILKNKTDFIQNYKTYESDIFALEKIIKLNKRLGNSYAVLRDEVIIKSYKLIDAQNKMTREILTALDLENFGDFKSSTNKIFKQNKDYIISLNKNQYKEILQIDSKSKILNQAKVNVKDFNYLVDINSDIITYITLYEKKMYRLNKYSQYNLIRPVLYVNNSQLGKNINNMLESYGLNIVKLTFMVLITIFVYIIRTYIYRIFEQQIYKIKFLKKYSTNILNSVRKLIEILIMLINIQIISYIYNDFVSLQSIGTIFKIIYTVFLTLIVYKVINIIASIKIHDIKVKEKELKNEVVNIGMKIFNFAIIVMGLLLVLYFAGVNLTAILSGLGIGGFAVALAAKDSLANFFGTLSILMSDIFSQGDWIEIDNKEGTVVEIGLRVTTLRTFDNAIIAIPNAILANKDVRNWNKRSLGRRIKMRLGIKYDSKQIDIKNAINEIREMLAVNPMIATLDTKYDYSVEKSIKIVKIDDEIGIKKTLLVYLDEFSDSSINILVYCFSKSVIWSEWLEAKEDVMYKIMEIFERNSLEFAFPSLSLYDESKVV